MKNSAVNTVKSVAVDTVKVITYPAHLVLQTGADLLNIGQAKAINLIDGTPLLESMNNQASWTQDQQMKVVSKYMSVKERMEKQRESNRQQDIARLKKALDKAEGVEHITKETNPLTDKENKIIEKTIEIVQPVNIVPTPPKATVSKTKAKKAVMPTPPLMTAPAV